MNDTQGQYSSGTNHSTDETPLTYVRGVEECGTVDAATLEARVANCSAPLVIRGLVSDWPSVAAAVSKDFGIVDYLTGLETGVKASVFSAPPAEGGKFFYNSDLTGFNFGTQSVTLSRLLNALVDLAPLESPPSLYAGAAPLREVMPAFIGANRLPISSEGAQPRIWIGNASRIATHFDTSLNIACVVAGRRRFTFFPPEQVGNLYVGPVDQTPAGQPVSMVDPWAADLERFPRFATAMIEMSVADVGPGDAVVIPPLWWHHVAGLSAINVLVNYWFDRPALGFPALMLAILALRDLPDRERAAWHAWFDHYVFDESSRDAASHLPATARGVLGPPSPARDRTIAEYVMSGLVREYRGG